MASGSGNVFGTLTLGASAVAESLSAAVSGMDAGKLKLSSEPALRSAKESPLYKLAIAEPEPRNWGQDIRSVDAALVSLCQELLDVSDPVVGAVHNLENAICRVGAL